MGIGVRLRWALGIAACVACGGAIAPSPQADAGAEAADAGDEDGECDPVWPCTPPADAMPPCKNLECQQVICGNGTTTSISGTVFDPSGALPLYDALVYVPNAPLDPLGGPTCGCGVYSGAPLVAAVTDAKGRFSLVNAPAGSNIPLVIQIGAWRREIVVPVVSQCTDNPADHALTRLPRKQHETGPNDNVPLVALVSGCDALECMLTQRVGVDPSEITGPTGGGRIHVYRGSDADQGLPSGAGDALTLFNDVATMKKYDAILLASDCGGPHARGSNAEQNLEAYLATGGRVLATHSQLNWFASSSQCASSDACIGDTTLSSMAAWRSGSSQPAPYQTNTTFPSGKAMQDWYQNVTTLSPFAPYQAPLGVLPLVEPHSDLGATNQKTTAAAWIVAGNPSATYDTHLFGVWTPMSNGNPCGGIAFSSEEGVGPMTSAAQAWPASCSGSFAGADHTPNELALEYMLFRTCYPIQEQPPPSGGPPPTW
jgi:hypothetical protein